MSTPDFQFNLGDEVRDRVTGLQGIVTGRCDHLTGCNTYGVQPPVKEGDPGSYPDQRWFDEHRLERLSVRKITIGNVVKPGAGPNPTPRSAPQSTRPGR